MRSDFFAVFQEQKRVDWVYPGDLISSGAAKAVTVSNAAKVLHIFFALSLIDEMSEPIT